ncbi:MAG: hypothetical protein JF595_00890, partial [Sphingomonadales bacterium]|nr:hypothetical protein [Sphingomonadales bacterium]
ARPRWHFWLIAGLSLLWNAFAAYGWLMTNMRDAAYIARFTPETMQSLDAMPYWALGIWTIGVWSAVLGSILLLLRSRFAVHAFAVALAGLAADTVYGAMPSSRIGLAIAILQVVFALWQFRGRSPFRFSRRLRGSARTNP